MSDLLKFITCGSVDDGKSTLIGHILYDSKLLYADQEQALLLESQVGSCGGDLDYALLLDGLMAEREQGITIDVAYRYFTTDARSFIVADTPGHEEYTRNMAVGASFADLAVILVDASRGVLTQTRRHARICAMMGIRYFVFAVNKMDLAGYDKAVFDAIEKDVLALKKELALENAIVIPLSATKGDNVTKASLHMPWYHGLTLLHYLETVDICEKAEEKGFSLLIQRVCRPDHTFRGFQGEVASGCIRVGERLTALPSREEAVVKSILVSCENVEEASAGQPVTIQLDREVDVSRGCVLTKDAGLAVCRSFTASLLWMEDAPLLPGGEYWIKLGTRLLPAVVSAIRYQVDINSGEEKESYTLEKNGIALCDITLSEAAVVDVFSAHKAMGELILIDRVSHATAACGVVCQVGAEGEGGTIFSDGNEQKTVALFDAFYYHTDTHTIVRHSAEPAVYRPGDSLPIMAEGYQYPADFDIQAEGCAVQVRGGRFVGFGTHERAVPLLDVQGFGLQEGTVLPFSTYRSVTLWEEESPWR